MTIYNRRAKSIALNGTTSPAAAPSSGTNGVMFNDTSATHIKENGGPENEVVVISPGQPIPTQPVENTDGNGQQQEEERTEGAAEWAKVDPQRIIPWILSDQYLKLNAHESISDYRE